MSDEPMELSEQSSVLVRQFTDWLRLSEYDWDEFIDDAQPKIGLYQLYEALASQRHELKLQTKSQRQTQELLTRSIEETAAAVDLLKQTHKDRQEIEQKTLKPFLTSLCEIDESLQRTAAALNVLQKRLMRAVRSHTEFVVGAYCDKLSLWGRFWQRKIIRSFVEVLIQEHDKEIEQILEPFCLGFEMLLRRIDDILKKHTIVRLNPVGKRVDPETMQVVGILDSETVEPGHVVDVVRLGYIWQGTPLRFADVRAVKST